MNDTICILPETLANLQKENEYEDVQTKDLQDKVNLMQTRIDDLEQHSQEDSNRIFELSECTPGSTDEKVLRLCNDRIQLQPPLSVEEIAISHRVSTPPEATDGTGDTVPAPRRPLLVKFSSRRSKNWLMAAKKSLKLPFPSREDTDEEEYTKLVIDGTNIYIAYDLSEVTHLRHGL